MKTSKMALYGIIIAGIVLLAYLAFRPLPSQPNSATPSTLEPQVVRMSVEGIDYVPSEITIEAGRPVKFIVDGTRAQGCVQYFTIPSLGITKKLNKGENIFEFTPTKTGTIPFSCTMGMATGRFIVI